MCSQFEGKTFVSQGAIEGGAGRKTWYTQPFQSVRNILVRAQF